MLGTTGYGLWDTGRAKLEQIFAEVMGAEDALVLSLIHIYHGAALLPEPCR